MDERDTSYLYPDQDPEWEYKTMRARYGEFGDKRQLAAMLRQEAQAGWRMVDKHSDYQVRLCRPRGARARDAQLPPEVDPYRTEYRASHPIRLQQVAYLAACVILALLLIVALVLVGVWLG